MSEIFTPCFWQSVLFVVRSRGKSQQHVSGLGLAQRLESVFPQSSGKAIIESRWPSRPDSLGIPSPFVRSPGWEASCRVQNLHNSVRTSLALLFSSLWITHLVGLGFSFYRDHSPLILLLWLLLCLWTWGIFLLVGSRILLLMAVQQLVAILVLSQEEMSTQPSTSPSWTETRGYFESCSGGSGSPRVGKAWAHVHNEVCHACGEVTRALFPMAALTNYHMLQATETHSVTALETQSLNSASLGWNLAAGKATLPM